MIIKVVLGTMQNAKKLVSIAESVPYEVELCSGRLTQMNHTPTKLCDFHVGKVKKLVTLT